MNTIPLRLVFFGGDCWANTAVLWLPLRYNDNEYEYRHVQLPKAMLKAIPKEYFEDPMDGHSRSTLKLLWEEEWRALGITQVGAAGSVAYGQFAELMRRVLAGSITRCMSQSLTYYFSSE